ncbi:MAG: OsmC family protein [Chitinophagaceae bacterium]|nr:OsmC family protein [Chitinophagaceae bacterium]
MNITARISWRRSEGTSFVDGRYSRVHRWDLDGGASFDISSSPEIVPVPMSDPGLMDPEEAFLASISACHMLFFLGIAAKKKWVVEKYADDATGIIEMNADGRMSFTSICLKPEILFGGDQQPGEEMISQIHAMAHANCILANSINATIKIV